MKNRNIQLFKGLLNGKSVLELAKEFHLSDAGVRLIVKKIFDETLAAYPELKEKHTKKIPDSERDVAVFNTKREFWEPYLGKLKTPDIWEGMEVREYPKTAKRAKKSPGLTFSPEKMARALSKDAAIPQQVANRLVSAILDRMREELKAGHVVVLRGIGTLKVVEEADAHGAAAIRRRIKLTSFGAVEKALKAKADTESHPEDAPEPTQELEQKPAEEIKPKEPEAVKKLPLPKVQVYKGEHKNSSALKATETSAPQADLVQALTELLKRFG
jgi:hypothetical protein